MAIRSFVHTNRSRRVYSLFERETVDTELLQRISEVLNHNFFKVFIDYPIPGGAREIAEPVEEKNSVRLKLEINIKGKMNKREILNSVREELDQLLLGFRFPGSYKYPILNATGTAVCGESFVAIHAFY